MKCAECGIDHPEEELELSCRRPDEIAAMDSELRARIVKDDDDLAVIDGKRFFVRALLPIPVNGRADPYNIGLWVEVAQEVFTKVLDLWTEDDQVHEPPFNAKLANSIPTVPETLNLEVLMQLTGPKTRPDVFVADGGHPLGRQQRDGVSVHRISEYSAVFAPR